MAYLGHIPATGDNDSFRILDDISSYTLTFDGSAASIVSVANDTITQNLHRFVQGQRVTYTNGGGGNIGGLTSGTVYYIINDGENTIKLATSSSNAASSTAINLTAVGTGTGHTLNVAFDGTNTKFKATYNDGTKARVTRSAQLSLSINGVLQQPHDSATPSTGFGHEPGNIMVFSAAPASTDQFWGHVLANNKVTFDVTDNAVDTFSGTGSATAFTLSKIPLDSDNVLVTIDGVVQYPSSNTVTRAYLVSENVITFTTAPANGTSVQVRHIGFVGASSGGGGVTNFYGRTGSASLKNTDDITVRNINAAGLSTFTGIVTTTSDLYVGGDLYISDDLTFDEATVRNINVSGVSTLTGVVNAASDVRITRNINAVGVSTLTGVVNAGSDVRITRNLNAGISTVGGVKFNSGIVTAVSGLATYYGDGSKLVGVSGGKFRGYTAGIGTEVSVGIGTTNLDNSNLTGVGNSFQGMYVSNGMIVYDNELNGNHYIGTNFNGLMAGPVTVNGSLTVDGHYVVV